MVKNYARSAYFLFTFSIITSQINASSLSPQKLSQKLRAAGFGLFTEKTGLINKFKDNDTHEALQAKIKFASTLYQTQLEACGLPQESAFVIDSREKEVFRIVESSK